MPRAEAFGGSQLRVDWREWVFETKRLVPFSLSFETLKEILTGVQDLGCRLHDCHGSSRLRSLLRKCSWDHQADGQGSSRKATTWFCYGRCF